MIIPRIYQTFARVAAMLSRNRLEREFDEELAAHIEFLTEENIRRGMDSQTARREALLEIGGVDAVRELHRDSRSLPLVESLAHDIRYGVRQLRRTPAFTIVTLLLLAIGIGANTAVFSQVNAVFWKVLPLEDPEELRSPVWTSPKRAFTGHELGPRSFTGLTSGDVIASFSYSAYLKMRDGTTHFSGLACWDHAEANLRDFGRVETQLVSGNYFQTMGARAAIGRTIMPDDDQPGESASVAMLSDSVWTRMFARDPRALHRTITMNGKVFKVVGVMPKSFFGLDPTYAPDVIVPIASHSTITVRPGVLQNNRDWTACQVIGRLRPGGDEEQARSEVENLVAQVILADPPTQSFELPRLSLTKAGQGLDSLRRPTLWPLGILMSAGGVVLLIVCANIAGLLFGRGESRRKEVATRLALGAPRQRLVRQLLMESLLLSLTGGSLGVLLAFMLSPLLPRLLSQFVDAPLSWPTVVGVDVTPDVRVLAFSIGLTVFVGVAFGTAPAFRTTRVDPLSMMKKASSRSPEAHSRFSGGKALVALQAALSMPLLIGAGLLIQTVINMRSEPLGFHADGLLFYTVEPGRSGYDRARHLDFFEKAISRVEKIPGILSVAASATPLLVAGKTTACVSGHAAQTPQGRFINVNPVTPRFFQTWSVPLLAGREVEWEDRENSSRVAIVNETFAKEFFGGSDALGKEFGLTCSGPQLTVVGVVADSKTSTRLEVRPTVYLPYRQARTQLRTFTVRTEGDSMAMIPAIRRTMADLDPNVPILESTTPIHFRDILIKRERFSAGLLIFFSLIGLLLSCIGIYSMLAYKVSQRTSEISLRVALGAKGRQIIRMIISDSVRPVITGIGFGLALAFALIRSIDGVGGYLRTTLFGVSADDPWIVACAALLFLTTAAIACAVPAISACRMAPMKALRHE